jgi:ubiquinone/menaquinone biosynthesis C-methylase UbiE
MSEKSFDEQHADAAEPWRYSERGGERLRHLLTQKKIAEMLGGKRDASLLEIGCSTGNLSELILPLVKDLHCVDISPIALKKAEAKLTKHKLPEQKVVYSLGSATALPAATNAYDFVLCSDGIYTWNLTFAEKNMVAQEIKRVLKTDGRVLFADYLKPHWMDDALAFFQQTGLQIDEVDYLGDRLWYKIESILKALRTFPGFKQLLRSITFAQALRLVGMRFGKRLSNHMMVAATKK